MTFIPLSTLRIFHENWFAYPYLEQGRRSLEKGHFGYVIVMLCYKKMTLLLTSVCYLYPKHILLITSEH